MGDEDMSNWRKASYSHDNGCVSVAEMGETIGLRDSKDPDGPVLRFTRRELAAWIEGCKAGEFDDLA
jgi:hypothetical protein